MPATDPTTFHAALRSLLIDHAVEALRGPRRSPNGQPADDIEGTQNSETRIKVTTLHVYAAESRDVERSAWFGALMGLPGVVPYPQVMPHPLGGAQVIVRWLDGTPPATRLPAGGSASQ